MIVISKLLRLARRYPLVPSMMTYSVLYRKYDVRIV